jgi:hypothetical protein
MNRSEKFILRFCLLEMNETKNLFKIAFKVILDLLNKKPFCHFFCTIVTILQTVKLI